MPGGATAAAGRDVEEGRPFFPNDARTLKGSGANARSQRKGPHSSTTSSSASASSSSSCGSSSATSWELLDSTIEAAGLGRLQLRIVSVVLFCYVMEGCLLSMVPLMFPILRKEWGVSNHELAFVGSSFAVGMMLGCFGAALLGDLAGRRRSIQVGLVVIFCAGLGLSFMPSLAGFSAMLGSVGLGIGLLIVVGTTYVCEMMPAAYRGTLIVLSSVATYLGGMICCGIGFGIFHSVGWRWLPAFLVAPFPAILALTSLIPESPRFQLGRGQFEEAAESLAMIAEAADLGPGSAPSAAQLRAGLKVKARGGKEQQRGAVAGAVAGAGMGAAAAAAGSKGNKGKTRRARVCSAPTIRMTTCVSKRNLVTLVPLMAVWFFNNLGKGIFQWIPLYIEEHTTVVKGQDPMDSAFIALVLFAAGGLIGNSILCVMVAQGFGRRILISMMMMLPSVCIVGLAFIKDPQHMMALIPLLEASSSGAGVLYTYTPEVFPTSVRVRSMAICGVMHRLAPILSPFLVSALIEVSFEHVALTFAGIYLLALGASLFLCVETAGAPVAEDGDAEAQRGGEGGGADEGKRKPVDRSFIGWAAHFLNNRLRSSRGYEPI